MKELKWIGVLPASIFAYMVANLLSVLVIRFLELFDYSNEMPVTLYLSFLGPGFAAALAIYSGVLLAPSFKKEVSIVLTLIFCIVFSISIFIGVFFNGDWKSTLPAVAGILGSLIYCLRYINTGNYKINL
ncbi:hypothetical protein [Salinimicrobium sp. WS361]|uniref:hypothetical protein n=1 Tax=Salinimicrobium sp. WS361 TaxID=3425123 RepID=UPI003D6DD4DE